MEMMPAMQAHPGLTEAISKLTTFCDGAELGTEFVETMASAALPLTRRSH
jgi:hypothetical protein